VNTSSTIIYLAGISFLFLFILSIFVVVLIKDPSESNVNTVDTIGAETVDLLFKEKQNNLLSTMFQEDNSVKIKEAYISESLLLIQDGNYLRIKKFIDEDKITINDLKPYFTEQQLDLVR